METLSQRAIGRMGSLLAASAGLVSVVQAMLSSEKQLNPIIHASLGATLVAFGIVAWFLPWQRWPRSRTLWILPAAVLLFGSMTTFGGLNPFTFGAYLVVVFVWIGVTQPRRTSLWFLPFGAAAYLVPIWFQHRTPLALHSVFELLVMCAAVGESLGWVSQHLRQSEALETRRLWDMQGLLQAGDRLARQTDAAQAAVLASDLSTQLLRAAGAVVLLPEDGGALVIGGSARWPDVVVGTRVSQADAATSFAVMRGTTPVLISADGLPSALATRHPEGSALVLVPLRGVSTVQGVLVLDLPREAASLDRFDEDMSMSFGTQAGLMLERLHAVESLMSDALVDELTGLGNRRSANLTLSHLQPGDAVVMLDLNRFKELNDTRGHAAGDEVLRRFGTHLTLALRDGDVGIRYGGDEFLLLLRGAGQMAPDVVERIRSRWLDGAPPVGFSVGISVFESGESPAETVARADEALYLEKRNTRGPVAINPVS